MGLRVTIVAAVTAASAMTCAFAPGSGTAAVGEKTHLPLICARSYDPYHEPLSVLRSCGDAILRLRHVTPLPGGGKAYDYGAYTQFLPPAHFNALKASDRQLREYGLPTRQRLGSRWYAFMRHVRHFVRPLPYLAGLPGAHTTAQSVPTDNTPNWSGYIADSGHSYNGVTAAWKDPAFTSSSCTTTAFLQWVGIGGWNESGGKVILGQDGTAFGYPGLGSRQAWIETSDGTLSPPVGINLYATKDQQFGAETLWDYTSNSEYDYSLVNYYTGDTWDGMSRAVSSVDLSSAEVIAERPLINGSLSNLTPFHPFLVTNPAVLWGSTGSSGLADLPSSDVAALDMVDGSGNLMAAPGSLNQTNSDFTNYSYLCS